MSAREFDRVTHGQAILVFGASVICSILCILIGLHGSSTEEGIFYATLVIYTAGLLSYGLRLVHVLHKRMFQAAEMSLTGELHPPGYFNHE